MTSLTPPSTTSSGSTTDVRCGSIRLRQKMTCTNTPHTKKKAMPPPTRYIDRVKTALFDCLRASLSATGGGGLGGDGGGLGGDGGGGGRSHEPGQSQPFPLVQSAADDEPPT